MLDYLSYFRPLIAHRLGVHFIYDPVLFDKFTQARRTGLRGEKTNGLGTSLIKRIVELHEDRVWVESAEGEGTTFYVELPVLPSPETNNEHLTTQNR